MILQLLRHVSEKKWVFEIGLTWDDMVKLDDGIEINLEPYGFEGLTGILVGDGYNSEKHPDEFEFVFPITRTRIAGLIMGGRLVKLEALGGSIPVIVFYLSIPEEDYIEAQKRAGAINGDTVVAEKK